MIRLLGCGDGVAGPRAAEGGFVPHLESLEGRAVPGLVVKIPYVVANPEVPAQVSTLPPPTVGLAPPPADGAGAAGLVQVPGGGEVGFDRGGDWYDPAKTDKDKFEPSFAGGGTGGPVQALGVWVGAGTEPPATAAKATPILM